MSDTATGNGTVDDTKMQKFELYIKASAIDKETKGSCPICQQFFMITCLLGENQDDIDFKVFTVQAECPPKNFAVCWSKKYPVVMVNSGQNKKGQDISGMMYDTFEDLETFFEGINTECPELKRKNQPNQNALQVVENVYKHFNHFIAGQSEKGLIAQLNKLNEYLKEQDTRFLVDNVLSFSDCHLLPRLQHMRVAGKHYRQFDIPKEFTYIWKYLQHAYMQDAFKSTISSDQDIMLHYEKKVPKQYKSSSMNTKLHKFTYTLDIPEDCQQTLDNGKQEQVLDDEAYIAIPPSPPVVDQNAHTGHNNHEPDFVPDPQPSTEHSNSTDEHSNTTEEAGDLATEIQAGTPPPTEEHAPTNGTAEDDDNVEKVTDEVSAVDISQ